MLSSFNFGEIPSSSISHAHPKTPRPTKKALSENRVREIDELNRFIEKNKFTSDTVSEHCQTKTAITLEVDNIHQ